MADFKININKDIFLPVYQPHLLDYSKRYNVYWGGRASGKTHFIIAKLLLKGLEEKRFIVVMQKRTNALKDTVWREVVNAIDDFQLTNYFDFNKSDFRATCKINGTEIRCIGLDEPEKIKGFADMSDVYLDEITQFTPDDLQLIDGTLRSPKYELPLQLYCSFNPVSKANFVYKRFGFDTGICPPNTFILHTTFMDNTFLPQQFIDNMEELKKRDPRRYRIDALGEFASLDKLVYNNWEVQYFNPNEIKGQLLVGLDFGYVNDVSALVASILVEEEKRIYIFREYGDTNKTNPELAQIISSLGFAKSVIIADSAEQKSIEEIKRAGIQRIKPSVKGPDSIIHGIERLQQYDIIVHPDCENVIEEFNSYTWQKDKQTGEYINKPVDLYNHYMDALRYSLQCIDATKLRTLDKSILGL